MTDHAKKQTKFEGDLLQGFTYKVAIGAAICTFIAWAVIAAMMSGDIMWVVNFFRY